MGCKAGLLVRSVNQVNVLVLTEGVPALILLVIALKLVADIPAAVYAGIDVQDCPALVLRGFGVKVNRVQFRPQLRDFAYDVADPFRCVPIQVDSIQKGQLPRIAAAAGQAVQPASAVIAVAQIGGKAVGIGVIGLAHTVDDGVIHGILQLQCCLFGNAAFHPSAGHVIQIPHLGEHIAIGCADGKKIVSESRRIRNQADDLLHVIVEGIRHAVGFAQVDQRKSQTLVGAFIIPLGIHDLGRVADVFPKADRTAARFIIQALQPFLIVAPQSRQGFLRGHQIVCIRCNCLGGFQACHQAGIHHHQAEMDPSVFQRALQPLQTHHRIFVQFVHDQAARAAAAVIPEIQHVMLSRIVFCAPADKIRECRMLCHAGKLLLVHEGKAVFVPAPALESVHGNVNADDVLRLPALRAAGLNQHVDSVDGHRPGDHLKVRCGHAVHALQIRSAEIDHHRPLCRVLCPSRFFSRLPGRFGFRFPDFICRFGHLCRRFRRLRQLCCRSRRFRLLCRFFCRCYHFGRHGHVRLFRRALISQGRWQQAAHQAQNQHKAEPF